MASSLTPEQIARIEQNRKLALEKRAARLQQTLNTSGTTSASHQPPKSQTDKPHTSTKLFSNYSPLNVNIVKSSKPDSPSKLNQLNSNVKSEIASRVGKPQLSASVVGTCKLISKNRFTVDMPYQQQAVDLFRTINGKEYGEYCSNQSFKKG